MYDIEVFFLRLLENSVPGYWKLLEYSWNFTEKVWHEPCKQIAAIFKMKH